MYLISGNNYLGMTKQGKSVIEQGVIPNILRISIEPELKYKDSGSFKDHVDYGASLIKTAKNHIQTIQKLIQEQKNQSDAFQSAFENVKLHCTTVIESWDQFYNIAKREMTRNASLLKSFPIDIEALHQIPIHPLIANESNKFLAEYVPLEKLRSWALNCKDAYESFATSVVEMTEEIHFIKIEFQKPIIQPFKLDIQKMNLKLTLCRESLQRLEARQSILVRDQGKVDSFTRDESLGNADKSIAIQHLMDIHVQEYIPEIIELDRFIRDSLESMNAFKTNLTNEMIQKLVAVSHLQSIIASSGPKITQMNSTLALHIQAFSQLLHVHRMSAAWGATLIEIVRRREYSNIFVSKAKEMSEILAKFRLVEERKRDNFKSEISRYLPIGLVKGLDDKPPMSDITLSQSQDNLPNLTPTDLIEFEKIVSNIRQSLSDSHRGGSLIPDSISKLQATIVKMSGFVNAMLNDFEKILSKSNLSERFKGGAEEYGQVSLRMATSPDTRSGSLLGSIHRPSLHLEETNKAYEEKIKNLEKLLQTNYSKSMSSAPLMEQGHVEALEKKILHLQQLLTSKDNKQSLSTKEPTKEEEEYTKLVETLRQSELKNQELQVENLKLNDEINKLKTDVDVFGSSIDSLQRENELYNTFIRNLYVDLKPYQPIKDELPMEPRQEWEYTFVMDQNQKLLREVLDEILIHRAEAANKQNPETSKTLSEESHQELDELVHQLEETMSLLRLSESRRVELEMDFKKKVQEYQETLSLPLKISYQDFHVHDLVLFLPTRNPIAWAAFNINTPHYFLHVDEHVHYQEEIKKRIWILAKILEITTERATEECNPFGLVLDSEFHLCKVSKV